MKEFFNMADQIWTTDMDVSLKKYRKAGYSFTETSILMSNKFNTRLTKNACIGRLYRIGVKK